MNNGRKDRMTLYEKYRDLIKCAKKDKDRDIREQIIEAAKEYYKADIKMNKKTKTDIMVNLIAVLIIYIIIIGSVILSFKYLSFLAAICTVIGSFALLCLIMGAFLRMTGLVSENNLLRIFREGFKALLLLRRSKSKKASQ